MRRATYRLQLRPGFGFRDAAAIVPYLAELGISHLYLSPIFQAAEGSQHGYDVVDPDTISRALGGEDAFAELVAAAHARGLGILLDIVPNHMSIAGRDNRWWLDVLENGPASAFAHYFDVDWGVAGDDRVLLPILGQRYGRALATGTIAIARDGGRFVMRAGDAVLPMSPHALGRLARAAAARAGSDELAFVGDALAALPAGAPRDASARARRHRDKTVLAARLAELGRDPRLQRALDDELAASNADPVALDALLEAQAYRLVHWSVASAHVGYRRFFDITALVGIRDEDPDVFAAVHARALALVASGAVDGLRVDHVDGLRDPGGYVRQLRARAGERTWIVVEKIVTAGETMPASWPVDGTTGYDFMAEIAGVFVDPDAERALTRVFEDYTGERWDPGGASRRARLDVMSDALHGEIARLGAIAERACAASAACRDFTRAEIERALAEIFAGYPTYRTYLRPGIDAAAGEHDRARIAAAVAAARDHAPDLERDLLAFLADALAFELASPDAIELATSAQQLTGAVVAKGDEDTLLYRHVRLTARCDVGVELRAFATSPERVHRALAGGRQGALLATSTHDSKRGEDVRVRIAAISELVGDWATAVRQWGERAARYWTVAPDRVIEYLLWQDLVGAWPISADRARAHALKAAREARVRTSWRRQDAIYEAALAQLVDGIFGDRELVAALGAFAARLAPHGDRNALAMLLVKLCAPGVPDFYQGSELRSDSLVDPDNRRDVDFAARAERVRWARDARAEDVIAAGDLGAAKLWTISRVLAARRAQPERWLGPYRPLVAIGPHARRVFAFSRGEDLVAIVPRLAASSDGWGDTTLALPPGSWRDVLCDRVHAPGPRPISELLRAFPIALLARA